MTIVSYKVKPHQVTKLGCGRGLKFSQKHWLMLSLSSYPPFQSTAKVLLNVFK